MELGAIERAPEEESGRIDYLNGTKFVVKLAGQSLTLVRTATAVSPSDYGVSEYAGYNADVYQANVEADFTVYLHIYGDDGLGNIDDLGWFAKDKSGTTYQFGTTATVDGLETNYYSQIKSEVENDEGETVTWISRWGIDSIQDTSGNQVLIS